MLDTLPADAAAATYLGFVCSAYFAEGKPVAIPQSSLLEDLLEWQVDMALGSVLKAFGLRRRDAP